MQTRSKIMDDISQLMTNAMGVAQGAKDEAETAMKSVMDRWLADQLPQGLLALRIAAGWMCCQQGVICLLLTLFLSRPRLPISRVSGWEMHLCGAIVRIMGIIRASW